MTDARSGAGDGASRGASEDAGERAGDGAARPAAGRAAGRDAGRSEDGAESDVAPGRRGRRGAGAKVKAGAAVVRNKLASLVWLVAVVCALFLAVGALLIALNANEDNPVVSFVVSGAGYLDGPFSLSDGIFTFPDDEDGRVRSALTNWGIAAVVYLLIGKILDRIIRP